MADYSGLSISSLHFAIIIMQTLIISSPPPPPPPSFLLIPLFCSITSFVSRIWTGRWPFSDFWPIFRTKVIQAGCFTSFWFLQCVHSCILGVGLHGRTVWCYCWLQPVWKLRHPSSPLAVFHGACSRNKTCWLQNDDNQVHIYACWYYLTFKVVHQRIYLAAGDT